MQCTYASKHTIWIWEKYLDSFLFSEKCLSPVQLTSLPHRIFPIMQCVTTVEAGWSGHMTNLYSCCSIAIFTVACYELIAAAGWLCSPYCKIQCNCSTYCSMWFWKWPVFSELSLLFALPVCHISWSVFSCCLPFPSPHCLWIFSPFGYRAIASVNPWWLLQHKYSSLHSTACCCLSLGLGSAGTLWWIILAAEKQITSRKNNTCQKMSSS